jgi:hypothetical protein
MDAVDGGAHGAEATSGCLRPGRAEGKHGLLCEHILRGAFGQVANAPADVKQMLRERGRLAQGTVVTDSGELE